MTLKITPTMPEAESYVSLTEAEAYLANRTDKTEWTALTNDQKEQLLKMATRQIDSFRFFDRKLFPKPMYYRLAQELQFPRDTEKHYTAQVSSADATHVVIASLANNQALPNDVFNEGALIVINGTGKGQTVLISDFVMETGTFTVETMSPVLDSTSQVIITFEINDDVKNATIEQAFYMSKGGGTRARLQAEGVQSYSIGDLSETFSNDVVGGSGVKLSNEASAFLKGYISKIGTFVD